VRASSFARRISLVAGLALAAPAAAGVADTPLPVFSDGKNSQLLMVVPGVVKRGRLQTDFLCTSYAGETIDIGVEIFDAGGARMNDVATGVGALLDVQPGQTVTIGTSGTATFLESTVIPLAGVAQGVARVVASAPQVRCNATIVDDAVTPPTSLATLAAGARVSDGPILPHAALPQFASGRQASHAALFPGAVKRGRVQTDVFCTSLATAPIDVGVEFFGPDGARQNQIPESNGALIDVPPGATVTFGTTGSASFLESAVVVLASVAQGVARVVSTSSDLVCTAVIVDSAVTPPTAMSGLFSGMSGGSADANGDGIVTAADVNAVVRAIFR
jgi:hypothetical protein